MHANHLKLEERLRTNDPGRGLLYGNRHPGTVRVLQKFPIGRRKVLVEAQTNDS